MEKNYYDARYAIYPVANFVCKPQNANGNPKWSQWLSVDPLAEKTMDPYGYCYQNPIKYIDPNGKQVLSNYSSKLSDWNKSDQQIIPIKGANGKTIEVPFNFAIQNGSKEAHLVGAIPVKP